MHELCLSSGDSDSTGKGILSAVMSRITGNADKASDAPASSNGTEAQQGEDAQKKKSMPELQASLPHVATRHVPSMTNAEDSQRTSFASTGLSIHCKLHLLSVRFLLNIANTGCPPDTQPNNVCMRDKK